MSSPSTSPTKATSAARRAKGGARASRAQPSRRARGGGDRGALARTERAPCCTSSRTCSSPRRATRRCPRRHAPRLEARGNGRARSTRSFAVLSRVPSRARRRRGVDHRRRPVFRPPTSLRSRRFRSPTSPDPSFRPRSSRPRRGALVRPRHRFLGSGARAGGTGGLPRRGRGARAPAFDRAESSGEVSDARERRASRARARAGKARPSMREVSEGSEPTGTGLAVVARRTSNMIIPASLSSQYSEHISSNAAWYFATPTRDGGGGRWFASEPVPRLARLLHRESARFAVVSPPDRPQFPTVCSNHTRVVSFADRASARCTSSRRRAPDSRAETDMLGRAPKTDRAETYR